LQTFDFEKPQFISIYGYDRVTKKNFQYSFYISPGDAIRFNVDFSKEDLGIQITGRGSNNNQPQLHKSGDYKNKPFEKDSLPTRLIQVLNKEYADAKANFAIYQQTFQPTEELIKDWKLKLKYAYLYKFYNFKSNMKFNIRDEYFRNEIAWNKVQDSLFTIKDLNNDEALNVPEYLKLVSTFLLRKKEDLWMESQKKPVWFYKEFYQTDTTAGKKIYMDDYSNDLKERIINKYFTGETAGYLYALLIEEAFKDSDPTNLATIFNRFKQKYPKNIYVSQFVGHVEGVVKKQKQELTNKVLFANKDGEDLTTFEEVLGLVKGKTVLLDMWGTWCAPCREEMEKYGQKIKSYFKDKGLDYLYIANFDQKNKAKWKELIPYFDLEGLHILANQKLTNDVMLKTKGAGYPTYIIIKKDGT
ncbi:MAG: TlpA family protein disulfide reductase, partial [Bacteroidia bacterium]